MNWASFDRLKVHPSEWTKTLGLETHVPFVHLMLSYWIITYPNLVKLFVRRVQSALGPAVVPITWQIPMRLRCEHNQSELWRNTNAKFNLAPSATGPKIFNQQEFSNFVNNHHLWVEPVFIPLPWLSRCLDLRSLDRTCSRIYWKSVPVSYCNRPNSILLFQVSAL